MADPFCSSLIELCSLSAERLKMPFHKNKTVITIEGPRFSTRAESHMFRSWNADVINMSTVPEVNLAREKKIHYAAIAMSTDYDCWREGEESVTWEIIMEIMQKNADNVIKLFLEVIPKIGNYNDLCIK
jgi:5'-methylthioadenosine phosphorylase